MGKLCRCDTTKVEFEELNRSSSGMQNWMAICNPSTEENYGEPLVKPPRCTVKTKTQRTAELKQKYTTEQAKSLREQQRELEIEWRTSQSELQKLRQVASPPDSPREPDFQNIYLELERRRRSKELLDTYKKREMKKNFERDIVKVRYNVHEKHRYFVARGERAPDEVCPHNGDARRKIQAKVHDVHENVKERLVSLSEDASHQGHLLSHATKKTLGIYDP
eukprot:666626-Rhodomonas_salina.3